MITRGTFWEKQRYAVLMLVLVRLGHQYARQIIHGDLVLVLLILYQRFVIIWLMMIVMAVQMSIVNMIYFGHLMITGRSMI